MPISPTSSHIPSTPAREPAVRAATAPEPAAPERAPKGAATTAPPLAEHSSFLTGKDQGPRAGKHVGVQATFIADKLQNDGVYALAKAEAFLASLKARRGDLVSDARQTAVSERTQRDVQPFRRALEDGDRQGTLGYSPVVRSFDQFVLPQAERIVEMIRAGAPPREIEGLAHDFVRGYAPFFAPNTLRTRWNHENQPGGLFVKALAPYKRKKVDQKAVEASNLVVDERNQQKLSTLLQRELLVGHYLAPEEITTLKAAHFDISLISPGVSAFWRRTTVPEVDAKRAKYNDMFPREDERLTYEEPRYRSDYSTKLTASHTRDGKKIKIKIKLGTEVHADLLASRLREYMGFNQDQMRHRDEIKVHLGHKTYMQFEREICIKYGVTDLRRCIARHGTDAKSGEDWVVFKDALIELRPDDEMRATILDTGVYDGQNRREQRTHFMLRAFLGGGDSVPKNHRMVLKQAEDGRILPEYRYQDLGRSFGRVTVLQRPRDLLNFPFSRNKIQEYNRNFIRKNRHGDVSITYNDTYRHARDDKDSTYEDLKWMGRVIASLPDEAIVRSIAESGIPPDLQEIYRFHITEMQNRVIKAFDLEATSENILDNPAIACTELPKAEDIHVGETVKKGKIAATHYQGKILAPKLQQTWVTFMNQVLGMAGAAKINHQIESEYHTKYSTAPGALLNTSQTIGATLLDDKIPAGVGKLSLSPGITATLTRVVVPNPQLFNAEGRGRPYMVRDGIALSIGVSSPFYLKALKLLSTDIQPKVQLLRTSIEHIHYAESVSAGYLSKPRLQKTIFGELERFAVDELQPGEVIRRSWAVGLDGGASVKMSLPIPGPKIPLLNSRASAALAGVFNQDTAFAKDVWGALHLLKESGNEAVASVGGDLFNINLYQLKGSLLAGDAKATRLGHDYWDIEVVPPQYDQEMAQDAATVGADRGALISALKEVNKNPQLVMRTGVDAAAEARLPDNVRLKYRTEGTKTTAQTKGSALYALTGDTSKEKVDFKIETEAHAYEFFKLTAGKRALAGFEHLAVDLDAKNLAVQEGTSKRLTLEMDRANPRCFVGIIDVYDYHRTLDQKGVEKMLETLNQRYSRDADTPFFRTDIPQVDNKYRKVYANGRIYVNGDKLLNAVENLSADELDALLRDVHSSQAADKMASKSLRRMPALIEKSDRALIRKSALKHGTELTAASATLQALRASAVDGVGDTPAEKAAQESMAAAALDLISSLYKSKYGVGVLQRVLGDDGILVMGEVFGIYHQTSMLQDDMWKSTLRFSGESWGKLTKQPPISHYIRYDQPTPPNLEAAPRTEIQTFLGRSVRNEPGNKIGFGVR